MRVSCPRITIRRLMALVALAALGCAGLDLAHRHLRLHRAEKRFARHRAWFDEGKITIDRFIAESLSLRDARLGVCWTRAGRVSAAYAHLDRSARALEFEKSEAERCIHCGLSMADEAEAGRMIEEARRDLEGLIQPKSLPRVAPGIGSPG